MQLTIHKIEPYVSYSLFFYMNSIYNQLFKLQENIMNIAIQITQYNIL